jgi:hypothetical protein
VSQAIAAYSDASVVVGVLRLLDALSVAGTEGRLAGVRAAAGYDVEYTP